MIPVGSVDGIPIHFRGVSVANDVMNVVIVADGPLVAEQGAAWHAAFESYVAHSRSVGTGQDPEFPERPGDRVLLPLSPFVIVDNERLPNLKENLAEIAGTDPPWQAWWRFVLPDHARADDAQVVVCVPGIERGIEDPVYAGPLRDVLVAR